MRVLMLPTYYGGISWWRFESPARHLRKLGCEVTCLTHAEVAAKLKVRGGSFLDLFRVWFKEFDLVHAGYSPLEDFVKPLLIARDENEMALVTDLDDHLGAVPIYNPGWQAFRPGSQGHRVAKLQLQHSNAVTLSTDPLKQALGHVNPNCEVVGNWLDMDAWQGLEAQPGRDGDKSIRLMMTGGTARYGDWQLIKDTLEWAMAKFPHLRLFFLGATPDWVLPWMSDNKVPTNNRCFYIQPTSDVPTFNKLVAYVKPDIMLSPVQPNDFNKCKSGLKYLEATATGAAFLCTDYPTYDIAPTGTCLKVDNTPAQWRDSLGELIENGDLRAKLVAKATQHVMDNCLIEGYISDRAAFYESVLAGGAPCPSSSPHGQAPQPSARANLSTESSPSMAAMPPTPSSRTEPSAG